MTSLLPPNATRLERNLATVNARLGDLVAPLGDLMNPATCPAPLLPWLASTMSVDGWIDAWTEEQKRAVIAASYQVHRKKGTRAALRAALDSLGVVGKVVEWWETMPQGAPYTFHVDIDTEGVGMVGGFLSSVEQQIAAVKPVRSHFSVRLLATTRSKVYFGAACQDIVVTTIYPKAP
ncbi:phage tail protein I [Massilia sp. CCM 8734]|uniref:phage tail protein I n=1 Tax=Massilia sp. CCM 8734 TaxID=2609283 RepID=UPI0014221A90|nr:phage tail protein I [Massilia sp. CCM 8734]NIA00861.1 phage tail protein I [Massilia sp. CCM 8734]